MEFQYVVFLMLCVGLPLWFIIRAGRERPKPYKPLFDTLPTWDDYQRGQFTHSPAREVEDDADIDAYCARLNRQDGDDSLAVRVDSYVGWDDTILLEPKLVKRWFGRGIVHQYYNGDSVTFNTEGRIVEMFIGGRKWKFHDRPL